MKLTKKDKEYLYNIGHSMEDVHHIEQCIRYTKYKDENGKLISRKTAIEKLGRETWLNGVSRSSFHWSAYKQNEDDTQGVYFDSRDYFLN